MTPALKQPDPTRPSCADRDALRPVSTTEPSTARGPTEVWKFGGSSVGDDERVQAVADRLVAAHRSGIRVVAVLSAMKGVTDELSERAHAVAADPPRRELDALLAVGEAASCALTAMAVQARGVRAVSLNAAQVGILTDDRHTAARLRNVQPDRVLAELDDDAVVLVAGFQGVSARGDLTTLGRGGSDASAVAVAAALGLDRCSIFTDVDGVFTADPRLVPGARPLVSLCHEEMLELAEGGAGVLQPRAVGLAAAYGVDIHLRSSFTSDDGTWIRREPPEVQSPDVIGVAHRADEPAYTISGTTPADVTVALAERGAVVGGMSIEGDGVLFTVPGLPDAEVAAALGVTPGAGGLRVHDDMGTVSVVSTGLAREPESPARVLTALAAAGIVPHLASTTAGRIVVHVDTDRVTDAVACLHTAFVGDPDGEQATEDTPVTAADEARPATRVREEAL